MLLTNPKLGFYKISKDVTLDNGTLKNAILKIN